MNFKLILTGKRASGKSTLLVWLLNNIPQEFIDCSNSRCFNGGFSVKEIIRKMVSEHKDIFDDTVLCQGYEGSPNGKIKYRDCINGFHIRIKITSSNHNQPDTSK